MVTLAGYYSRNFQLEVSCTSEFSSEPPYGRPWQRLVLPFSKVRYCFGAFDFVTECMRPPTFTVR